MERQRIKRKKCKCQIGCDKWPSKGCSGYAYSHLPEDLKEKIGNRNKLRKKNRDKLNATSRKLHAAQREVNKEDVLQNLWYRVRRHEMKGQCSCGCYGSTSKNDDRYYKFSCAHVLAKKKYPSVALHYANCVELSFWGGCHSEFDDKGYEYCKEKKPVLWQIVVQKFQVIYPDMSEEDKAKLPQVLIDEL